MASITVPIELLNALITNKTDGETVKMIFRTLFLCSHNQQLEDTLIEWISSNRDVFTVLVKSEYYNVNGSTAIHFASQNGYARLVQLLITDYVIDVNTVNRDNQTPLWFASRNGRTSVVECLIKAKADVNTVTKGGTTPLYWASRYGRTEVVECLINAKADVNIADKEGTTPLNWASRNGHTEIVTLLIKAKADVNIADKEGKTPLYWASRYDRTEIVKFINDYTNKNSVSVTVTNDDGTTKTVTVMCTELFVGGEVRQMSCESITELFREYSANK